MDRNNKNARYGMRKLAVGFVSCMLGLSMVFASVQGTVAKEEAKTDKKTEVVEVAEKELTKEEQIKLKQKLNSLYEFIKKELNISKLSDRELNMINAVLKYEENNVISL